MQDIDFDEIDRAVSSVSDPRTQPVVTQSLVAEPVVEVASQIDRASLPQTVAPRPSSGRFMDVVHPSSDMRPSAPSAPSMHREEVLQRDEVAKRPEPITLASSAFHWPDATTPAEPTPIEIPEPVEVPVSLPEPIAVPDFIEEEVVLPLESPFLSDATIEKRPLGAFSGADANLPLLEDPIPFSGIERTTPEEVIAPVEPTHEEHEEVPEELHETLLSLDGHNNNSPVTEPLLETTYPEPVFSPEVIAVSPELVPSGPTSITQQYTEQPSTISQPSGSIFDTEAYHQPVAHPAKKRSVIVVVIWILALLIVGGGIGTAVYLIVFPMIK